MRASNCFGLGGYFSFLTVRDVYDILLAKLASHSMLSENDQAALRTLPYRTREFGRDEDLVRQGEIPRVSVMLIDGEVARYHMLPTGRRQYLSLHFAGDWPDLQSLLLTRIDHSLCALNDGAAVAMFQHEHLRALAARHPSLAQVLWRETLIDASIFRAAITNNSARGAQARMAHLFCEIFYRSKRVGLLRGETAALPMHQSQLGETLGMALVTVNRTLRALRRTGSVDFKDGRIFVRDWEVLAGIGEFDPDYLNA